MLIAAVVKSADTRDLKSLGVKSVPVQVRSAASPYIKRCKLKVCTSFIFTYKITFSYKKEQAFKPALFSDKNLWG